MTRSTLLVLATTLTLLLPEGASAQVKHYPLEATDGLRLHNVAAEPAVLQGKKGLRVTFSEETVRRFKDMTPEEQAEAQARVGQYAVIEGLEFANGVIEAEVAGAPAPGATALARGFVGIAFRLQNATYDAFYLRPTNGRAEDQERRNHAVQYVSHPDWPWFRLRKEFPSKYESYVDLMPDVWTKIKIEVRGERARLYVHGQEQPTLIVNDLKSGAQGKGGVALWIDQGTVAHFRNLTVKLDPDGKTSRAAQAESIPTDSPRWQLEGKAKATEYLGRRCLWLQGGGGASLKDFEMTDGVIDVDMAGSGARGFYNILFRTQGDGNSEMVYLRPHKTGLDDAQQYTPILNGSGAWQIYNGPGFTRAVDIPRGVWFHVRLEITGAQAKLYVNDMREPSLVMNDLKSGIRKGGVGLEGSGAYFSNFEIRETPPVAWERHEPAMPAATITKWSLSPSLDGLERDLERPLSKSEAAAMKWQDITAEPPGFVVINRYRRSPEVIPTFANDFSKRLEPQKGMRVVYARTTVVSDRDQLKKLNVGYSDDVSVFLNDKILYRGRSAQRFRDPGFLGIVNPENDAVYLPLKKGRNELMLAVSELTGGWGFICRFDNMDGVH